MRAVQKVTFSEPLIKPAVRKTFIIWKKYIHSGACGSVVVKALCCKLEGCGFKS
jgi:hypothetical protein